MLTIKSVENGVERRDIFYRYIGKDATDQETRDLVNARWEALSKSKHGFEAILELPGQTPTVFKSKSQTKMAYEVIAKFDGNDKQYHYPSKKSVKAGDTLVVHSPYGCGFPTVISCLEVEESTLPARCKVKDTAHLNWVIGVLNKF